jgi:hypothetical protein
MMESAKEIVQSNLSNPRLRAETMEKVLLKGDLGSLTPAERLHYYNSVCTSVGLNPLTKPFDYLVLNSKLVLYANRGCAEQLRQIHNVNLTIKAREAVEGCFVVSCAASLPGGRTDESVGAVSLEGLKGEARANAMMKAETKAKRRATLSICGLTFLDESEIEAIPGAARMAELPPEEPHAPSDARPWTTFRQMIEIFAALKAALGPDREALYYQALSRQGVEHANQFKDSRKAVSVYHELQEILAENFPPAAESPAS